MEEDNPASVYLFVDEWVSEVNKLTERFRDKCMVFQVQAPFLRVCSNGFLPSADTKTLHVPLRPGSPEGLASGVVSVSLPESKQAQYLKCENESSEVFLSAVFLVYPQNERSGTVRIRLATSWEFFWLVTGEARTQ